VTSWPMVCALKPGKLMTVLNVMMMCSPF
jgi:hypothetical protein